MGTSPSLETHFFVRGYSTTSECTSDSEYDGWYPLSALIGFFDDFDDYSDINGLNEDFLLSDDDW